MYNTNYKYYIYHCIDNIPNKGVTMAIRPANHLSEEQLQQKNKLRKNSDVFLVNQ